MDYGVWEFLGNGWKKHWSTPRPRPAGGWKLLRIALQTGKREPPEAGEGRELSDIGVGFKVKSRFNRLMNVHTTLNFFGRTEEAVAFYCRTIEAETLFMMRFRDCPDPSQSRPGLEEKIFHATFRIGSTEIGASDCGCERAPTGATFAGFSFAIQVETPEKAERFFAALRDGGQVQIPLVKTFFAARYGIVIDRFGISWKIMVESR
jgi:PhnB protein